MESLYRIVFAGELAPGKPPREVVAAFSERFRVTEERARELVLGGRRLTLKHDLNRKRAARYCAALEETGLRVIVELQNPQPGGEPADLAESIEAPSSLLPESEVQLSETVVGPDPRDVPQRAPKPAAKEMELEPTPGPKCGAYQVARLTGVCQACGVVVERYLARRAAERGEPPPANPYAPPQADLEAPPPRRVAESLGHPRGVTAGRGWGWLADAWPLFAAQPWAWMGALLLLILIYVVLGLIPVTLVGLFVAAWNQYRRGDALGG